jgi:hypothetical protein
MHALLPTAFLLSGCGGGGGGGQPPGPPPPSPPPPPNQVASEPEVGIKATPSVVVAGQSTSLEWGSIYADSCVATAGWSSPIDINGTAIIEPIDADTTFGLSCSGAGGTTAAQTSVTITTIPVASVSLDVVPATIEIGQSAQAHATLLDSGSRELTGRALSWESSDESVATISPMGRVLAQSAGTARISVLSEGQAAAFDMSVIPVQADTREGVINAMLVGLAAQIESEITYNESLLANNPRLEDEIRDLLDLLRTPSLADDIRNGERYEANAVESVDGRRLPIVSMFPRPSPRQDAIRANGYAQLAMPFIEEFYQTPYPAENLKIWYGFKIGNSGRLGTIDTEDQTTYETRRGPVVIGYTPFEAIVQHELGHSYMGNETLNQFVELYAYNRIYTNSVDVNSWIWTRNYVPFDPDNANIHGILDIYQLIGHEAMSRAYRNLHQINPPYGSPLSEEGKRLIIDEAPSNLQEQVRAILDRGV